MSETDVKEDVPHTIGSLQENVEIDMVHMCASTFNSPGNAPLPFSVHQGGKIRRRDTESRAAVARDGSACQPPQPEGSTAQAALEHLRLWTDWSGWPQALEPLTHSAYAE